MQLNPRIRVGIEVISSEGDEDKFRVLNHRAVPWNKQKTRHLEVRDIVMYLGMQLYPGWR